MCIVGTRQLDGNKSRLKDLFDSYCMIKTIDKDILYEVIYKNSNDENHEFNLKFENRETNLCLYNVSLNEKTINLFKE